MGVKKIVWQVGLRSSGARLADGGEPAVLFWVDPGAEQVRHIETLSAGLAVGEIEWERLFQVALASELPGGCQQPPQEIAVDDQQVLACLNKVVAGLGIKVVLRKKLAFLDEAYESLTQFLQEDSGFNYLADGQLQPEEIEGLAEDMLDFMAAAPFEVLNGDDILEVQGHHPSPLFFSILGMGSMEFGLGIYLNRQAAEAYQFGIQDEEMEAHPALSLTLVAQEDCPALLAFEVGEHQWPCHPLGFPLLARVDGERTQPTSAELRLARDLLRLAVLYVEKGKAGTFAVNGHKLKVRPFRPRQPQVDLRSLIFSQLMSGLPGAELKPARKSRARR